MTRFRQHPALAAELVELLDILNDQAEHLPQPLDTHVGWNHRIPLAVHSRASLDEILAALGDCPSLAAAGCDRVWTSTRHQHRPLLRHAGEGGRALLTSTMYRDYAISPDLFHWESQSTTSVDSPTGQRYLNHRARGSGRTVREASQARRWSNGRVHLPRRGRLCVASGQSSDCDHLASAKADA